MVSSLIATVILLRVSIAKLLDTINCSENSNQCRNTTIICFAHADCLILCTGPEQCIESIIICPQIGNCLIQCNQHSSCINTHIIGPSNGILTTHCNGKRSCLNATFDASNSEQLYIKNCTQSKSCFNLSLYCPINPINKHSKNCFIEGNDNLGGSDMEIYTKYGWNDLEINYTGTFKYNDLHNGIMFCGEDYDISCNISLNNWIWICINNTNIYCNNSNSIHVTIDLNDSIIDYSQHKHENKADGYMFVGAWVLALAIGYIICGGIRHALKSYVLKMHKRRHVCETDMSVSDSDEHVIIDGRVPTVNIDCE